MGKMSFPEDLERTSRTVMATRSASTREAMLFGGISDGKGGYKTYRMPTIREIASIMSFPITYQFEASNESSKYRLVGNAVCPRQSRALAVEILGNEKIDIPESFIHISGNPRPSFDLTGLKRKIKDPPVRKLTSRYYKHIPKMKVRGFRVELNNKESNFKDKDIHWSVILHQGSGKNALRCKTDNDIIKTMIDGIDGFTEFQKGIDTRFDGRVPDALSLQKAYCNIADEDFLDPAEILKEIRELIDDFFPCDRFSDRWIENNDGKIPIKRDKIPLRILAGNYALNKVVEKINP